MPEQTNPAAQSGATTATVKPAPKPRFTLKPSRQTCMVMSILIGVLVVGGIGLYVWQSQELGKFSKVVATKQQEVESGEKIAKRLERVMEDYNSTQGELRYLETSVTGKEYVPTLLRQTEQLAKSVNLKVASVRPTLEPAPEPPKDEEARKKFKPQPYDRIKIEMQVQGGYWNVARLLYRLTEFPKILSVEGIQVQTQGLATANQSPQLSVNLRLVGFIFPNDGKPLPDATAAPATGTPPAGGGGSGAAPAGAGNATAYRERSSGVNRRVAIARN